MKKVKFIFMNFTFLFFLNRICFIFVLPINLHLFHFWRYFMLTFENSPTFFFDEFIDKVRHFIIVDPPALHSKVRDHFADIKILSILYADDLVDACDLEAFLNFSEIQFHILQNDMKFLYSENEEIACYSPKFPNLVIWRYKMETALIFANGKI